MFFEWKAIYFTLRCAVSSKYIRENLGYLLKTSEVFKHVNNRLSVNKIIKRNNLAFGDEPRPLLKFVQRFGKHCSCHLKGEYVGWAVFWKPYIGKFYTELKPRMPKKCNYREYVIKLLVTYPQADDFQLHQCNNNSNHICLRILTFTVHSLPSCTLKREQDHV
jgi:hypothetical protein